MFFKNVAIYQVTHKAFFEDLEKQLETNLNDFVFKALGSQDLQKQGWVSPLPCGELLTHIADGRIMLALKEEHVVLPADAVKKELAARVAAIELEQGRKVKKKEKDSLKEDIVISLLPRCFTKSSITYAYLSPKQQTFVVDAGSFSAAEKLISYLRKTLGSFPVVPPQSKNQLDVLMTDWLVKKEHPATFEVMSNAKLASALQGGGKVTFKDEALFSDEVLAHVSADKFVTEIGLRNENLSFTLTETLHLKSVKFDDVLQEQNEDIDKDDAAARFDADFALMAGTLDRTVEQLFTVLNVIEMEE